ncbi:Uma2 family endonuclease [Hymenobacter cheonanensis]|uniref:Uma2 family endonuclease n=1 Tax=Hymenobacter sp. CA2-7 TaxID=3063993 RepID=UPI0027124932|nr:Uma2 family endonuclease [Hymenobacter sp. CA2-7]MDO7887103.1 Uma2 family endonuclease [Hymenobacter sp. CA2-7]
MAPITDISQLDQDQLYTYADYLSWRFSEYVELIKGKILRKMSAPTSEHQQLVSNLHGIIWSHLRRQKCQVFTSPFDVRLLRSTGNGDAQIKTVVQPDISVICDLGKIDKRGCLGAPDWIVEIVLPSSLVLDTRTKFDLYAENEVGEYWIAYPGEQIITAYALSAAGQYELTGTYAEAGPMASSSLPELAIDWADIFEERL